MNAAALIEEAARRGIAIEGGSGTLTLSCPAGTLDAEFEALLRSSKAELVALLTTTSVDSPNDRLSCPPPRPGPAGPARRSSQLPSLRVPDEVVLHMLSHQDAAGRASLGGAVGCAGCGRSHWWRSRHHDLRICRTCHPPAAGAEAAS